MDIKELRKADLVSSILITAFGIFVVLMSTKMPMSASYGGVESNWYVAPALFPLFIGSVLIILGLILLSVAIRAGAHRNFFDKNVALIQEKADKNLRVWIVALTFGFLVYIYIPYFDFLLCLVSFLFTLIAAFYPDDKKMMKGVFAYFFVESIIFFILTIATGMIDQIASVEVLTDDSGVLDIIKAYNGDTLLFFAFIGHVIYTFILAARNHIRRGIITLALVISIVFPLIVCPTFRYPLRTILPFEGIVMEEMMNRTYYYYKYYGEE